MKSEHKKDRANHKNKPNAEEIREERFVVFGKNPVLEILKSDTSVDKILIQKDNNDHVLGDISDRARKKNIIVKSVDKSRLTEMSEGGLHQGVVAVTPPYNYAALDEIVSDTENQLILILDHITDPHNLGAIIRSANLCGVSGIVIPDRRASGITPVVTKASSGALSYTKIVKVGNLTQVIKQLKDKGFWVAGAHMKGEAYYKANLSGKIIVVIGNEGKGIGPKLLDQCDFTIKIPNYGQIDSFNASAAAAIVLAEAARQQHQTQ